jgi:hypothetical protein
MDLNAVILSIGIKEIPSSCFENCSKLTYIDLPEAITSIGDWAFDSSGLTAIVMHNVASLNAGVFRNCVNLASVALSEGLESIPVSCFADCANLKSIKLPETITDIGLSAFLRSGLTTIAMPDNLTFLATNAFFACQDLTSVNLSKGLTTIPDTCFANCTKLTLIELHDGITHIGDWAFQASGLRTIVLPDSLTTLDDSAFSTCQDLTSVIFGKGLQTIPETCFAQCTSLTNVEFGVDSAVETIETRAFQGCGLINISLPDSLMQIGSQAFANCASLVWMTLGPNLATFSNSVLVNATNLRTIAYHGNPTNPSIICLALNYSRLFGKVTILPASFSGVCGPTPTPTPSFSQSRRFTFSMSPSPSTVFSQSRTVPTNPSPPRTDTKNSGSGSKKGLTIGLSIGFIVIAFGAAVGVFLFFKWRGNRKSGEETERAEGLVEDVEGAKAYEDDGVVEPVLNP